LLAISPKEPPPRPEDLLSLPNSLDCRDPEEEEPLSLSEKLEPEEYRSSADLDPKKSEEEEDRPP
jgi:hypothetical protein